MPALNATKQSYRFKYRWMYDTQDPDVGVRSGEGVKRMDFNTDPKKALKEIHRWLNKENPESLRRSYKLLEVAMVDDKDEILQEVFRAQ